MRNITRVFPENGVTAVHNVWFKADFGEIHGLVGENGTGKSTLMHILSGMVLPDKGRILLSGKTVPVRSPRDSLRAGVGMIHQHVRVIRELSFWENIVLCNEPVTPFFTIDRKKAVKRIVTLSKQYDLSIDPYKKTGMLTAEGLQKTAILGVLYHGARVIILDEPTILFGEKETDTLFSILRKLRDEGKCVILITHKLKEALALADRITVMRNAAVAAVKTAAETGADEISTLMIGSELLQKNVRVRVTPGQVLFEVKNLSFTPGNYPPVRNISISVRGGETVAVTGIRENGLETLERLLCGLARPDSGTILVHGNIQTDLSPRKLRELGIAYIPTDRMVRGASIGSTVEENLIILNYRNFHAWGMLKQDEIDLYTGMLRSEYGIKGTLREPLSGLSGGNIQKVIISRELAGNPPVVIFSEPSWGLDFRSRELIFRKIEELKKTGSAVLIITSDIDEAVRTADTITVMYRGSLSEPLENRDILRTDLGKLMLGVGFEAAPDPIFDQREVRK